MQLASVSLEHVQVSPHSLCTLPETLVSRSQTLPPSPPTKESGYADYRNVVCFHTAGSDVNDIVKVLVEEVDWEELALQLSTSRGDINNIAEKCKEKLSCCYRNLVTKFCDSKGNIPVNDVVAYIVEALGKIGRVRQGDVLKEKFPGGIARTTDH